MTDNFRQVSGERSGQLYSYRINSSVAILGTRNEREFGASIGIGIVARGTYICIAQNGNENNNVSLEVIVSSKFALIIHTLFLRYIFFPSAQDLDIENYLRFSSPSFMSIKNRLNLTSSDLVIGIIETALLRLYPSEEIKCSSSTL